MARIPSGTDRHPLILGAGPAGLACAHELARSGVPVRVLEKAAEVGGLCRTIRFRGCLFDVGGHRFLSKSAEVNALWRDTLGNELIRVRRRSRIFFKGRFFDYPLSLPNALKGLGMGESLFCFLSYAYAKAFVRCDETSFEGWMIKRFGRRLYETFFKTYTEKVWAVPCSQLSSRWAVQRIQGLSLARALARAVGLNGNGHGAKTLSEEFFYPVRGPGLFCERLKNRAREKGASFTLGADVRELRHDAGRIRAIVTRAGGQVREYPADYVFSTIPLTVLVRRLAPEAPARVLSACQNLRFRSFLVVNLIYDKKDIFPDNWIYIHSPSVRAGRIQNYKNWSPEMVPNPSLTTLGVEYFVTEGDGMWSADDAALVRLAADEVARMGLVPAQRLKEGFVLRVPNAYPVYGPAYEASLTVVKDYLDGFDNLQVLGRAGLFRYDNSDHAILCGLFAARNLMGSRYDLWGINTENEHHEEYQSTEFY